MNDYETQLRDELKKATDALNTVLHAVQRYLPPDGISERDAMAEIIGAVDPWPLSEPYKEMKK